jgi:four helix bundle protein
MTRKDLEHRTKNFHINVIKLCASMPKNAAGFETAKQVIRSAGSVGANYRATKRAKSTADFIHKLEIVLEEADESHYWLEIIKEAELLAESSFLNELIKEANELTAIFSSADRTSKQNRNNT